MSAKPVQGLYAAVLTPRKSYGTLDEAALQRLLDFLLANGITRFAFNGATGDYPLTTWEELEHILAVATRLIAHFVCGIGAASLIDCLDRARVALDAGSAALMLPMPHFYSYEQDDLQAFCLEVAGRLPSAKILLYNLPSFTSPLTADTCCSLIAESPNIVGIKDSGPTLDILRALPESACRMVGNDSNLCPALREGVADGVISGIACVLPELVQAVYEQDPAAEQTLVEFHSQMMEMPLPWALKLIAEARGIIPAQFPLPLSPRRHDQARALVARWGRL